MAMADELAVLPHAEAHRLLEEMNETRVEALASLARYHGAEDMPDPRLVALDEEGVVVGSRIDPQAESLRISFTQRASDAAEVRSELDRLFAAAGV